MSSKEDIRDAVEEAVSSYIAARLGGIRLNDLLQWASERDIVALSFDPNTGVLKARARAELPMIHFTFSTKV